MSNSATQKHRHKKKQEQHMNNDANTKYSRPQNTKEQMWNKLNMVKQKQA